MSKEVRRQAFSVMVIASELEELWQQVEATLDSATISLVEQIASLTIADYGARQDLAAALFAVGMPWDAALSQAFRSDLRPLAVA